MITTQLQFFNGCWEPNSVYKEHLSKYITFAICPVVSLHGYSMLKIILKQKGKLALLSLMATAIITLARYNKTAATTLLTSFALCFYFI